MLESLFDTVAKQIHYCLVLGVCEEFESWMMSNMDDTEIELCLAEDKNLTRKRQDTQRKLTQFEEGLRILGHMSLQS